MIFINISFKKKLFKDIHHQMGHKLIPTIFSILPNGGVDGIFGTIPGLELKIYRFVT